MRRYFEHLTEEREKEIRKKLIERYKNVSIFELDEIFKTNQMIKKEQVKAPVTDQEVWQDISHEEYRSYVVPTVAGQIMDIKIENPTDLQRNPDGSHIIKDSKGIVHEINAGWVKLTYKVK